MKDGSKVSPDIMIISYGCDVIVNGFKEIKITKEEFKKIILYFDIVYDKLNREFPPGSTYQTLTFRVADIYYNHNNLLNRELNNLNYSINTKKIIFLILLSPDLLKSDHCRTIIHSIAIHCIKNNIILKDYENIFIRSIDLVNKENFRSYKILKEYIINKIKLINNLTRRKLNNLNKTES